MSTNKIAQLSLLSAACVAGRIAFQFIPNFQPMTAIFLFIVLYLSLKDALIVMSLSIAISSFYFGVGPWVLPSFWRCFQFSAREEQSEGISG